MILLLDSKNPFRKLFKFPPESVEIRDYVKPFTSTGLILLNSFNVMQKQMLKELYTIKKHAFNLNVKNTA